jgi:hypothetical protein
MWKQTATSQQAPLRAQPGNPHSIALCRRGTLPRASRAVDLSPCGTLVKTCIPHHPGRSNPQARIVHRCVNRGTGRRAERPPGHSNPRITTARAGAGDVESGGLRSPARGKPGGVRCRDRFLGRLERPGCCEMTTRSRTGRGRSAPRDGIRTFAGIENTRLAELPRLRAWSYRFSVDSGGMSGSNTGGGVELTRDGAPGRI